jgi:GNAT superfamily N-acetyltransferase
MTMVLRPTTLADTALLPAIEVAAGQSFLTIPGLEWIATDSVMSAKEHEALLETDFCYVAEVDQSVVGFIATDVADTSLHIHEISVHPDWQGHGIGRDLIMTVIDAARPYGFAAITLTTFRDVPWNAPFYERLGFQILHSASCDDRLSAIVAAEVSNGLPGEQRCAMRYDLIAEAELHG